MASPLTRLLDAPTERLVQQAHDLGLAVGDTPDRDVLVARILEARATDDTPYAAGVLEVHGEGFGFLRSAEDDFLPGSQDIYVSQSQIRRFGLRTGDTVIGRIRPPKEGERYAALLRVEAITGDPPDAEVLPFEEGVALPPSERLPLERDPWLQAVGWLAPLGLGDRGLLVGPSRGQRDDVLMRLARLLDPSPDADAIHTQVLLLGARPEDITTWRAAVPAPVIATPFDELPARHCQVAEIVFERARRRAERGESVLLLVDSLTRAARFAATEASTGRDLEGIDAGALLRLRRWLASARDLEGGGSVTLVATANPGRSAFEAALLHDLTEVASWQVTLRPDALFPGTTRPALDPAGSYSRHEARLLPADQVERRHRWRRDLPTDPAALDEALAEVFRPAALDSGTQAGQ